MQVHFETSSDVVPNLAHQTAQDAPAPPLRFQPHLFRVHVDGPINICCIFRLLSDGVAEASRNTDCLGMVVSTSYFGDEYFFHAKIMVK